MRHSIAGNEIERKASALFAGFHEIPVPVHLVAAKLNLSLEPVALSDDVSAVLVVVGDRGFIGFNRDHSHVRQRFSIAHEIGHFLLHRSEEQLFIDTSYRAFFRDTKSGSGSDIRERDANAFAAALLMPADQVRKAARVHHFELGDEGGPVQELSQRFGVSTQAMTIRLVNLGILRPALAPYGSGRGKPGPLARLPGAATKRSE